MNYSLDMLIHEIGENRQLLDQLKQHPETVAESYSVHIDQLDQIRNGDLLALYKQGVHPLSIMKLARTLGIDVTERYKQLLGDSTFRKPQREGKRCSI